MISQNKKKNKICLKLYMNTMNLPEKHCNDLKFKHFKEKSY